MHWSNWKLAARRVNENLLIHTARTINYHFVCGTAIRHVRDWIFPSVRSHHRCATFARFSEPRTTRWGKDRVEGNKDSAVEESMRF